MKFGDLMEKLKAMPQVKKMPDNFNLHHSGIHPNAIVITYDALFFDLIDEIDAKNVEEAFRKVRLDLLAAVLAIKPEWPSGEAGLN